jgi:hypothetical protein
LPFALGLPYRVQWLIVTNRPKSAHAMTIRLLVDPYGVSAATSSAAGRISVMAPTFMPA